MNISPYNMLNNNDRKVLIVPDAASDPTPLSALLFLPVFASCSITLTILVLKSQPHAALFFESLSVRHTHTHGVVLHLRLAAFPSASAVLSAQVLQSCVTMSLTDFLST